MRNVNTIEFDGRKACINSFSDHPALVTDMNKQREYFANLFPSATVKTERMSHADTVALVAAEKGEPGSSAVWEIGSASQTAI